MVKRCATAVVLGVLVMCGRAALAGAPSPQPSPQLSPEGRGGNAVATTREAVQSEVDVWGEAALKQAGGPSYDFFEKLLPPLRYVDASFHVYPITLSAPSNPVKV